MAQLIVISRIDGNPVAWRCSTCRQVFTIPGQLATEARRKKVAAEFQKHVDQVHPNDHEVAVSLIHS